MTEHNKSLTQLEVYNILHSEVTLRTAFNNMFPDGKNMEQCSREAHLYCVKWTWHWFNNQDEFKKYIMFNEGKM